MMPQNVPLPPRLAVVILTLPPTSPSQGTSRCSFWWVVSLDRISNNGNRHSSTLVNLQTQTLPHCFYCNPHIPSHHLTTTMTFLIIIWKIIDNHRCLNLPPLPLQTTDALETTTKVFLTRFQTPCAFHYTFDYHPKMTSHSSWMVNSKARKSSTLIELHMV